MSNPSAYACMRPYSMPLCTIFTKWPEPDGPQWRNPRSAVPSARRPGLGGPSPVPGARVSTIGWRGRTPAADHQTVAALEPPDATARADVDVEDLLRAQHLRPASVVLEVRVPAVDDH